MAPILAGVFFLVLFVAMFLGLAYWLAGGAALLVMFLTWLGLEAATSQR
jgi:hypothetical protein